MTVTHRRHQSAIDRIKRHIAGGGKATSVVPGDGWESLTHRTCCTFLIDAAGDTESLIVETAIGEPVDDAGDFLCEMIVAAQSPTPRLLEMGIRPKLGAVFVITCFDGVPAKDQSEIREKILALSKNSQFMGHASDYGM